MYKTDTTSEIIKIIKMRATGYNLYFGTLIMLMLAATESPLYTNCCVRLFTLSLG